MSSPVARSCRRRCSAPSCCARAAAPAGGIIVRWSQAARRPSEERSASSASRSRRDSRADIRDRLRAAPRSRDPRVMDAAFHGFGPEVFAWFDGLERDNSKAYFTATREHYEANVRGGLQAMLEELTRTFGGEVKVFRQQRNLRFAPAGSAPYKTRTYGLLHGVPGTGGRPLRRAVRAGPVRRDGLSPAGARPARALPYRRRRRAQRPAAGRRSSPPRGPAASTSSARACAPRRAAIRASTRAASCCATRRWSRAARCRARAGIGRDDALENVAATWRAAEPLNAWLEKHVGASTMAGRLP